MQRFSPSRFAVHRRLATAAATATALAAFTLPLAAQVVPAPATRAFDIPAQPLPAALALFARQAEVQIVFAAGLAEGLRGNAVSGLLRTDDALVELVRGTGLRLRRSGATLTLERGQQTSTPTLDEVTVSADGAEATATSPVHGYVAHRSGTALKTDTPLIETPQSITVVGAEEMAARKTDSIADALGYTNSIVSQPSGFSRIADDYNIRGFDAGGRTGSVMRDGMKLQASQFDGGQEPYGLERVELLRGPSSVLYGQMAPGGLINTVSKRPTTDPMHEIVVEAGSHDRRQIATDHAGALNADGTLSYRLTALVRESGTQLAQVNDDKRYIAPALTWRPNTATSLTLLASAQRIDTRFVAPMSYDSTIYSRTAGLKIPYTLFTGEPSFDHYEGRMTTLGYVFEHQFDGGPKLRHGLRHYATKVDYDYITPGAVNTQGRLARRYDARHDDSTAITSDTSLEWKLGSGLWEHTLLAGFDVYRKDYDGERFSGTAPALDLRNPVYGSLPVVGRTNSGSRQVSLQSGVYLQDQIRFDDRWVMVLGGRYDRADSRTDAYNTGVRTEQKEHKFSGRVGLVRLFDNGLAPYASFSQSFFPSTGTDRGGQPFKPTLGEQIEAGIRYQPAGSSTSLSAALYQLTQTNVLTEDPVDSGYNVQTGKVRSRGLELEARMALTRALSLTAAYNYTDARTIADNDPALVGRRTEGVPRHTASLWVDYKLAALGLERARVGAGVRYVGPLATASSASVRETAGYTLIDLLLSYQLDAHWLASLKVQNLADKRYLHCASTCRYGDLRTVTATLGYRW